ncbi:hypothetical protein LINPERPRIM_LOCUS25721 [Linum perenne]
MTAVQDKKTFPEADVDKELNPGHNKTVEADSTSSKIAANKWVFIFNRWQEKADAENAKKKGGGGNGGDPLKTTVIMSMIFAAVAGAAFGIAKILREKR